MILLEFFQSPSWRTIQTRFFATLGLSGVGTIANAYPQVAMSSEHAEQLAHLDILTKWLAAGSYFLSGIVAITILIRFIIWIIDRYKNKNNDSNSNFS